MQCRRLVVHLLCYIAHHALDITKDNMIAVIRGIDDFLHLAEVCFSLEVP